MKFRHVLAMFSWFPISAAAQTEMTLPAQCTGFLTAQLEDCTVLNHYRCAGEAENAYWIATFDDTQTEVSRKQMRGLAFLGGTYRNGQQVEVLSETDQEDYRSLMADGVDRYDYRSRLVGRVDSVRTWGQSALTGKTTVVDGVTLHRVRSVSNFVYPNGSSSEKVVLQYVMATMPVWIPDRVLGDAPGEVIKRNGPTDFIWPGEAGFMTVIPQFNCGLPTS